MRSSLPFLLGSALALVACSKSSNPNGGDDTGTPDAPAVDPDGPPPPQNGFQIITPDVDITPGQEVTYCYYFHIATTSGQDVQIKQWTSHMTPGSHHMILFTTSSNSQPDGTLSTANCGLTGGGLNIPTWTYSAQTADASATLPANDGNGTPVGQLVKNGQAAFIQMHYLNSTDNTLHAHVQLDGIGYDPGTTITPAAPYVTFNTNINIPAGSSADPSTASAAGSCAVDPALKFYVMTTHAHKQAHETFVKDGGSVSGTTISGGAMVVDSTDWEHPTVENWNAMPFYQFTSGKLSYQCDYVNPNTYPIHEGDSAATNEMCMAVGYYFPGTRAKICLNSTVVQ